MISSCFVAPVMFLRESLSFIEPWVCIHLTPTTGLHVKTQIIDWLFVRTGVLIWTFQHSVYHSERVPFISTWFVCADCSLAQNLLFCGSWLLTSVFICSLIHQPQSTASFIRLSILVLSSSYADSWMLWMLRWRTSCLFSRLLSLQCTSSSEQPPGAWASAGLSSFCPSGKDSSLSLALQWEHSSVACVALILASNLLPRERCSLCFTLFIFYPDICSITVTAAYVSSLVSARVAMGIVSCPKVLTCEGILSVC